VHRPNLRAVTRYAVLPRAQANRVYGAAAPALARAELAALADARAPGLVEAVGPWRAGGVDYLALDTTRPLTDDDVAVLANLSALHALFRIEGALLAPITITPRLVQDDDVTTIQRYQGKTNEQFTHLLVNVTLAAAGDAFERLLGGASLTLLDPVCGRGTSLNRAVAYGMDAVGVDADRRDLEAYHLFLTTWLKDKRIPHKATGATLRKGRNTPARTFTVTYGPDRKAPDHRVHVVNDDTTRVRDHVPARSVDVAVADLPYGVQHESRGGGGVSRRPGDLLAAALPAWASVLRPSGALGLAWNLRTLPRPELVARVRDAGLHVVGDEDDDGFVHKVDRAITRDVLVATPRPRQAATPASSR
jgi:SAM-dependent methyltransferase